MVSTFIKNRLNARKAGPFYRFRTTYLRISVTCTECTPTNRGTFYAESGVWGQTTAAPIIDGHLDTVKN